MRNIKLKPNIPKLSKKVCACLPKKKIRKRWMKDSEKADLIWTVCFLHNYFFVI